MKQNVRFEPLVSIIVPVYNGADYIKEAIASLLAQKYKNIEIIVVNDGSTDETDSILKQYKKRIKYYKKKNGGVSTALNFAIKHANGEYISWLSHDDLYSNDKIDQQIDYLNHLAPKERANTIIYSDYIIINPNGEEIGRTNFAETHEPEKLDNSIYPILNGLIHGCTLLIPREAFYTIGTFNPKLKTTQDYDLWYRMFPRYKVRHLPKYLVKSRLHPKQGSKLNIAPTESSQLWINMINSVDEKDINILYGGLLPFYQKTLKIITEAKYTEAIEFLEKKIETFNIKDRSRIKISVIIPFHNRVDWTLQAIESVINQTHTNWEIILINDGSTDNIDKLKKLIANNPKIIYKKNIEKSGAAKSRNIGIDSATGDFIAFLDSDDQYLESKLELQIKFMLENGLMVSHTSYSTFGTGTTQYHDSGKIDYKYPDTITQCRIATPTVMIRKEALHNELNRFPENMELGEDICLWIRLSKYYAIKGIDLALTKVRNHETQAAADEFKQIIGLRNIINYTLDNFLDKKSYKSTITLLNTLSTVITKAYTGEWQTENFTTPISLTSSSGLKFKMKNILKNFFMLFPMYRKLQSLENSLNTNSELYSRLITEIDFKQKKDQELIYQLSRRNT